MYHSFLSASWPTTCLIVQKKHCKSTKPEKSPCFSFFFFFSFRQASSKCMTLSWWFLHQKNSILHCAVHQPIAFHNFEVSRGGSIWSLNNYDFINSTIFFTCTHAHKSLSNETVVIQDRWITNMVVCMKTGRVLVIYCCLSASTEPGQ